MSRELYGRVQRRVLIGPAATFHSINACITAFLGEQRDTGQLAAA